MPSLRSSFSLIRALPACWLALGCMIAFDAVAQSSPSTLPPQVVTRDPELVNPPSDTEEDEGVTISPDERGTSIRAYGPPGRPSREVVDPSVGPEYSVSAPAEPQSVMPDADPVRGDMVQPPMWTLWSW